MQLDVSQALYSVEAAVAGRLARQDLPPPRTLDRDEWPPDYARVLAWRRQQLAKFEDDPALLASARAWYAGEDLVRAGIADPAAYAERCIAFICHWVDTFDPRLIGAGRSPRIPLVLFRRQAELVHFIYACMLADAPGLVEKSRDMGATWVVGAVTVKEWLFQPGFVAGWGSNKAEQVDVLGNPKSIFEKLRMLIRGLPAPLRPAVADGVDLKQHTCRNPDNGAVIDGEIGKNIGRGGRSRLYVVDEAAHLEHPEAVEASLSENTRCRIDVSSVSPPGTVFYRKRYAGRVWSPGDPMARDRANVFIMDWSEHPDKSPEWYAARRSYYEAQGTPSVVAREIDRDYMGAAEGIIIPYRHVQAAVDAHRVLEFEADGGNWDALDVADEGVDTNALVGGRGGVVTRAQEWGERDPGATARRAFRICRESRPTTLQYDCIGLGTNVKSEFNRITQDEGVDVSWLTLVPWAANAAVLDPGEPVIRGDRDSPTNKNYFENFKAQAWWSVARMFYRTWRLVEAYGAGGVEVEGEGPAQVYVVDGEDGPERFSAGELISLDSKSIPQATLSKLMRELSQAVMTQSSRLKLVVDKAPEGAKSPNLGDALIMGRFPARAPSRGRVGIFGPKILHG